MATPTHGSAHSAHESQNHSDNNQHDAQGFQDGDPYKQTQYQKNDS